MTAPAQPVDDPGPGERRHDERPQDDFPLTDLSGDDSAGDEASETDLVEAPRCSESGLLPQYSFRTLAIGLTTLALAAFTYRQSTRGSIWAEALVFAAGTILA